MYSIHGSFQVAKDYENNAHYFQLARESESNARAQSFKNNPSDDSSAEARLEHPAWPDTTTLPLCGSQGKVPTTHSNMQLRDWKCSRSGGMEI